MLPTDRPNMNRRERAPRDRAVARANWAKVELPAPPKPAHWLTDFMAREGILHEGGQATDWAEDEPDEKSYRDRLALKIAALLGIGIAASFAYLYLGTRDGAHVPSHAVAVVPPRAAVALNMPRVAALPTHPHEAMPAIGRAGGDDNAFSAFPEQPVEVPPTFFDKWAGALVIPQPESAVPKIAAPNIAARKSGPSLPPPLLPVKIAAASPPLPGPSNAAQVPVASAPQPRPATTASSLPIPPTVTAAKAAGAARVAVVPSRAAPLPTPVSTIVSTPVSMPVSGPVSAPVAASVAASGPMPITHAAQPAPAIPPVGTPLHLRIVYASSAPAEAGQIAALAARLRAQIGDIATARVWAGKPKIEDVVYFFPNDRAGASRIAAGLAQITKRTAPVVLVHANPLPRPGTIEIRLPLKDGKALNSEGS